MFATIVGVVTAAAVLLVLVAGSDEIDGRGAVLWLAVAAAAGIWTGRSAARRRRALAGRGDARPPAS